MGRRRDTWGPTVVPRVRTTLVKIAERGAAALQQQMGDNLASESAWREVGIAQMMDLFWVTRQMQQVALDASHDIPEFDTGEVFSESRAGLACFHDPLPPVGDDGVRPVAIRWMRNAWLGPSANWSVELIGPGRHTEFAWEPIASLEIPPGRWDMDAFHPRPHPKLGRAPTFIVYDFSRDRFSDVAQVSGDPITGRAVAAFLAATLTLMWQPGVAQRSRIDGHTGGTSRPGNPVPTESAVTLIDLRPLRQVHTRDDETDPETGRVYRHRWVVRGHWRQQPHGKGRAERRLQWIAPYVKGPEGAPLLEAEKVMVWRR